MDIKRICQLEKEAGQQEDVINEAATNLKAQKDKFNSIIDEMREIIRDERTGQGKIDFSEKEKGSVHSKDTMSSNERLTKEPLRLPDKKK